jgi:tRNA threonylcarbamoyladenosine modification (KEOPS) complex Cgi121 subunit
VFGIRPTEIEIMGAERVAELVLERVAMSEAWR